MMVMILLAGAFAVGLSIGLCGVAGFLLPLLFIGYAGYTPSKRLFISFCCFLISGAIGAWTYYRRGEMPLKIALPLGLSSLAGSTAGAVIGQLWVGKAIQTVLYVVVLISGLAIFVQEWLIRKSPKREGSAEICAVSRGILVPIGFVTALICAMSGAGGPVVVMPLLVLMGIPVRMSVGIALFDSIFIAIPSIFVYGSQCTPSDLGIIFVFILLCHTAGILIGSMNADHIPQTALKRGVAVFSVAFAVWKLFLS